MVVAYGFSMEVWVSYKLIGGFALTFGYIILTFVYLHRLGLLSVPAPTKEAAEAKE